MTDVPNVNDFFRGMVSTQMLFEEKRACQAWSFQKARHDVHMVSVRFRQPHQKKTEQI